MENRLNTKSSNYTTNVKNEILEKINNLKRNIDNTPNSEHVDYLDELDDIIKCINSIKPIVFTKEDFMKRKRSKNSVTLADRCMAKRANGEQCSRRKKEGCEYCGTHIKGLPHGVILSETTSVLKQKEVWCEDIGGIIHYIDGDGNVYSHEDVMNNVVNPTIIAKYKLLDNKYIIVDT